jgi:hypothetical protein
VTGNRAPPRRFQKKTEQGSEFSGSLFNGCGFSGEFFNREPLNREPLNHAENGAVIGKPSWKTAEQ